MYGNLKNKIQIVGLLEMEEKGTGVEIFERKGYTCILIFI